MDSLVFRYRDDDGNNNSFEIKGTLVNHIKNINVQTTEKRVVELPKNSIDRVLVVADKPAFIRLVVECGVLVSEGGSNYSIAESLPWNSLSDLSTQLLAAESSFVESGHAITAMALNTATGILSSTVSGDLTGKKLYYVVDNVGQVLSTKIPTNMSSSETKDGVCVIVSPAQNESEANFTVLGLMEE